MNYKITKLRNYGITECGKIKFSDLVIQKFSNSRSGFTLIELVVSVALFIVAISIALFAVVGTNGLIQKADARSAVSESTRSVSEMIRQTVNNAPIGGVSILSDQATTVAIQVKGFSELQSSNTCTVIGRATATIDASGEEKYTLAKSGAVIAILIYNLDSAGLCPKLNPIYQNRLTNPQAIVKEIQFSLQNIVCVGGAISPTCAIKQMLRYSLKLELAQKGAGGTSEARQPTLTVQEGVPIGLINEAFLALKIETTTLPNGTTNQPYISSLVASGGVPSYTWLKVSGSSWVTISSDGTIGGTPTSIGIATFKASVTDLAGTNLNKDLSITISNPVSILTNTLVQATEGVLYTSNSLSANGGSGSYTWSLETGSPVWLTISGAVITGTPPTVGATTIYDVIVKVQDTNNPNNNTTETLQLTVKTGGGTGDSN